MNQQDQRRLPGEGLLLPAPNARAISGAGVMRQRLTKKSRLLGDSEVGRAAAAWGRASGVFLGAGCVVRLAHGSLATSLLNCSLLIAKQRLGARLWAGRDLGGA
jgi:hypothetical protein